MHQNTKYTCPRIYIFMVDKCKIHLVETSTSAKRHYAVHYICLLHTEIRCRCLTVRMHVIASVCVLTG